MNEKPKVITVTQIVLVIFQLIMAYAYIFVVRSLLGPANDFDSYAGAILAVAISTLIFWLPLISFILIIYKHWIGRWLAIAALLFLLISSLISPESRLSGSMAHDLGVYTARTVFLMLPLTLILFLIFSRAVREYFANPNKARQ